MTIRISEGPKVYSISNVIHYDMMIVYNLGGVHLSRLSTTPRDPIAGMVLIGDLTITQVLPSDDSLVLGCIAPTLNGGNKMQTITLEVISKLLVWNHS